MVSLKKHQNIYKQNMSIQEASASINLLLDFYKRQRSSESLKYFYDGIVKIGEDQQIGLLKLSGYKMDLI